MQDTINFFATAQFIGWIIVLAVFVAILTWRKPVRSDPHPEDDGLIGDNTSHDDAGSKEE